METPIELDDLLSQERVFGSTMQFLQWRMPTLPPSKIRELMGQPDITARATWSGERLVQVLNSQAFEQAVKEQEYIQTSQAFEKAKADLKKLGRKLKMARL